MVEVQNHEFTKRIKDIIANVTYTDKIKYLEFLNETEYEILQAMAAKNSEINLVSSGGFIKASRNRVVIAPQYIPPTNIDAKVTVFNIEVIANANITHSQILGSLMALNISRSIIGDITVTETDAMFAACKEFEEFLFENFTKVGRHDIRLAIIDGVIKNESLTEEIEVIVSSMRLDVIVKALTNSSRKKAEDYLDAGFVRHNHNVEKKVSKQCRVGDILSIRKHGRFKIIDNNKTTKSGKIVLVVNKSI